MENNNGNTPAYPVIEETKTEQYNGASHTTATCMANGLTKREHFAALAMQGLLASLTTDDELSPIQIARSAVRDADALLAELERTK